LDVRRVQGPPSVPTFEVRNPRHRSHYTLYVPAYPDRSGAFCGCVDFARRDLGTCKHIEAAWLWLADHPEELRGDGDPAASLGLWSIIDRRLRHPRADDPPSGKLRYAGEVLLLGPTGAGTIR
jgi:hypothetical protein